MGDQLRNFCETAKGLARNPLGIIALFIVFVCGFASLVTAFAGSFTAAERLPLIYFLILYPVLVLMVGKQTQWNAVRSERLQGRGELREDADGRRCFPWRGDRKGREYYV